MNRQDWLKAVRKGLLTNFAVAIGSITAFSLTNGLASALALAVLVLDALSAVVFIVSSYMGKTAAEMALVMTVLGVVTLMLLLCWVFSYLFSGSMAAEPEEATEAAAPLEREEGVSMSEGEEELLPPDDNDPENVPPTVTDEGSEETPVVADEPLAISEEDEKTPDEEQVPSVIESDLEETPLITDEPETADVPSAPEIFVSSAVIEKGSAVTVDSSVDTPLETADDAITAENISSDNYTSETEKTPTDSEDIIENNDIPEDADIYVMPDYLNDDFWADFYIPGEGLEFEDGIYYFDLYANGEYCGEIEAYMENQEASLLMSQLKTMVEQSLTDDAFNRIFVDDTKYISLTRLSELGVRSDFDSEGYIIDLFFSASDMPVQTLSLKGNVRRMARRPITGGTTLEPAVFTLGSRYTLTSRFSVNDRTNFADSLRFSFRAYNQARLYDVYLDLDYGFDFSTTRFDFNLLTYKFYTDFTDPGIRLQWGNISSDLLSPRGTTVGIRFDKDPIYSDDIVEKRSAIHEVLVIDKESEVQVFNDGKEIYRDTLQPGVYRLEDFTLYSGINHIKIRVTPLDGTPYYEKDVDIVYSNSLLSKGQVNYGASVSIGRYDDEKSASTVNGQVKLPLINKAVVYDFRNVTLSGYFETGLTDNLTLDATLALQNSPTDQAAFRPVMKFASEMTHANILGTTRYNFNVTERAKNDGTLKMPGFYARVGHQVSTGFTGLSSFNVALAYSSPEEVNVADRHRFLLSTGISGRVGIMGYSLNYSGTINSDKLSEYQWNLGGSLSFSFNRNVYLSASFNVSAMNFDIPAANVTGRVAMTFYFGNGNVTVESTGKNISANTTARFGKHSINASADLREVVKPDTYGFGFDYDYSGNIFNVGVNLDASEMFRRLDGTLSLSTASIFADGLMAFQSYIPSNFVLIGQSGALKGNQLTVGSSGSSATREIGTFLDMGIYTGLSSRSDSSFALYSVDPESFSGGSSFEYNLPYSNRKGYAIRITADNRYSASGVVVLPDDSLWINGASPLHEVSIENGNVVLKSLDNYIFADSDGRFTITDLEAGTYAFDVMSGDEWILYIFTVGEIGEDGQIEVFDSMSEFNNAQIPEPYIMAYMFNQGTTMTSNEFWSMLYPSFEEAV